MRLLRPREEIRSNYAIYTGEGPDRIGAATEAVRSGLDQLSGVPAPFIGPLPAAEKKKRVVKKKVLPPFAQMEGVGTQNVFDIGSLNNLQVNIPWIIDSYCALMLPYTDFIPLAYLLCREDYGQVSSVRINTVLQAVMYYCATFNDTQVGINAVLGCDNIRQFQGICYHTNDTRGLVAHFSTDAELAEYRMRAHSGLVSPFTIIRKEVSDIYPEILAVVTPENYTYQKLNIMVKNQVDLNKVIILVNKELDSPSYPIPSFRSLYMKHLLPILKGVSSQVWKVPMDFIKERCFLHPYKVSEMNIHTRTEKINEYARAFVEDLSSPYLQVPVASASESERISWNGEDIARSPFQADIHRYSAGIDPYRLEVRTPITTMGRDHNGNLLTPPSQQWEETRREDEPLIDSGHPDENDTFEEEEESEDDGGHEYDSEIQDTDVPEDQVLSQGLNQQEFLERLVRELEAAHS